MGVHTDEGDNGHAPDEEGDAAGADGAADVEGEQPEDRGERGVPEKVLVVQLYDGVVVSLSIEDVRIERYLYPEVPPKERTPC